MGWRTERIEKALDLFLDNIEEEKNLSSVAGPTAGRDSVLAQFNEAWNGTSSGESKSAANNIACPEKIGPYLIKKKLGQGGFGAVFLGSHSITGHQVAVKLLHRNQQNARMRFFRESVLSSELKHESVISSFEFGEHEGQLYYVMDYVEGVSFEQVISRMRLNFLGENKQNTLNSSPLPSRLCSDKESNLTESYGDFVLRVALEMAKALEFLHARNIVHRDFKPGNILIDLSGKPKLTDLGLAQNSGNEEDTSFIGTYPYVSPEQIRQEELDPQSDIFSFGASFYEAITLRQAFSRNNRKEILNAILFSEPISPRNIDAKIPVALEKILLKCLQKDRRLRYSCARDLVKDLQALIKSRTQTTPRISKWYWSSAALVVVTASVAYAFFAPTAKTNEISQEIKVSKLEEKPNLPAIEPSPIIVAKIEEPSKPKKIARVAKVYLPPSSEDSQNKNLAVENIPAASTLEKSNSPKIDYKATPLASPFSAWPRLFQTLDFVSSLKMQTFARSNTLNTYSTEEWANLGIANELLHSNRKENLSIISSIFNEVRTHNSQALFGSRISAAKCFKLSEKGNYPYESIPYQAMNPESMISSTADGIKVGIPRIDDPKIADQFAYLLVEEIKSRTFPLVVLDDICHPSEQGSDIPFEWKVSMAFLKKVHAALNNANILCITKVKLKPWQISREDAELLAEATDGILLMTPFSSDCRGERVSKQLDTVRLWLNKGKMVQFISADNRALSKEAYFLAALSMMVRNPGDCILTGRMMRQESYDDESWIRWPEQFGAPLDSYTVSSTQPLVLQRKFQNATLTLDVVAMRYTIENPRIAVSK